MCIVVCLPDEDKEWVEGARSLSDGRFIGEGEEEGMILWRSKNANDQLVEVMLVKIWT